MNTTGIIFAAARQTRRALALALIFALPAAGAEEIDLLCTAKNGDVCELYVDTDQKYVTYCNDEFEDGAATKFDGKQSVTIDGGNIQFGDDSNSHSIDRYTGILSREMKCVGSNKGNFLCSTVGANSLAFDPVHCARRTKKF